MWERAEIKLETNRDLMQLSDLMPPGVGKVGGGERCSSVNQVDWGNLVAFWSRDFEHYARFRERRLGRRVEEQGPNRESRLYETTRSSGHYIIEIVYFNPYLHNSLWDVFKENNLNFGT